MTVYLIFFLIYTPLNVDHVRGVQGRYFVIALPMAANFIASMTNVDLPVYSRQQDSKTLTHATCGATGHPLQVLPSQIVR